MRDLTILADKYLIEALTEDIRVLTSIAQSVDFSAILNDISLTKKRRLSISGCSLLAIPCMIWKGTAGLTPWFSN
jgi:hypothetical protein